MSETPAWTNETRYQELHRILTSSQLECFLPSLNDDSSNDEQWTDCLPQAMELPLPLMFYQHVVAICPSAAATALPVAVDCRDPNPELVRILLKAAPSAARVRHDHGLLPIEMVTSHILAKDEAERYSKRRGNGLVSSEGNWECACILASYLDPNDVQHDLPLLHTLLLAAPHQDIPLALMEKALRRYPHQASLTDHEGNLPLHICAQTPATEDDLLEKIYKLYPQAAHETNSAGCLPLDLAIAARRSWANGVGHLVHATALDLKQRWQSPIILCELLSRACPSTRFAILQTVSSFL